MNAANQRDTQNPRQRLDRARDTGMALTLLALIVLWARGNRELALPTLLLVATMTVPRLFSWPARLWFGLSHGLGFITTRVVLTLLYGLVLLPVALIRRLAGKDPMLLRRWKSGTESVFVVRDDTWTPAHLERPY